jgi:putatice virulence related protein PagC
MKNFCLALAACVTLGTACNTMADSNHTVSMGYANSKVQDAYHIKGVNIKYRYEWDSPLSVISSLTYMGQGIQFTERNEQYKKIADERFRYYSLAAGPAFRFNDFISIYSVAGVNFNDVTYDTRTIVHANNKTVYRKQSSEKKTSFMYGAGIQFNPRHDISLDVGYEGSSIRTNKRYGIDGFNVGIGYRF